MSRLFKKGAFVRCIDGDGSDGILCNESLYEISEGPNRFGNYRLLGTEDWWMPERFELAYPLREPAPIAKFLPSAHANLDALNAEPKSILGTQVGGSHYTDCAIQPIEYIWANKLGFSEGNIIKYVTRWRTKGGVKDLEKAKHHIALLIEHTLASESK